MHYQQCRAGSSEDKGSRRGRSKTYKTAAAVVMTNYEKSEDRLSENVEGVKEAKIVKARDYSIFLVA